VLAVYPNPGSGRFDIRVSVASRLAVYDAGGRLKAVLLPKGGEAVWDAGTLSSGVYLIRALDADGVEAERVVRFVRPR
jgi:hypothetical protein